MNTRADLIKVLVFVTVTGLLTVLVSMTLGGIRVLDTHSYQAVFRDISGLQEGVEVRAAGVDVGSIDDLTLEPDNTVTVGFSVSRTIPVTTTTRATIRYKNLTGDMYLDLTRGSANGRPLAAGGTIPVQRTAPALDLDVLTNGFKPLLQGLSPRETNELAGSLIAVFQGQAGAVHSVLGHVASLTSTLATRDELIGRLIDNLNTVLGTVNDRRAEFGKLIGRLQKLTSGLAADRRTIGSSLSEINTMAATTSDFLAELRPEFHGTMKQTDRLSSTLNAERKLVDHYLGALPRAMQLTGRASAYGSFFNFYMCGVRLKLSDAKGVPVYTPFTLSDAPRCQFQEGDR